jgi:hypothetical protein
MKNSWLFLLLTLLALTDAFAQNPGYKGRNFSISVENFFSSSLIFPNSNGEEGFTAFNNRHGGRLGYTLSKNLELGFNFGFYNTKLELSRSYRVKSSNNSYIESDHDALGDISGQDLNLSLRIAVGDIYMPLGEYIMIGAGVYLYETTYNEEDFKYNPREGDDAVAYSLPQDNTHQFNDFGLKLGLGRERVLGDFLFVDYALNFEIITSKAFFGDGYCCSESLSDIRNDKEYLEQVTSGRSQAHHLINVKIAVGYMPF